jgi:bifunctional DNA-binding transcriptional regulator/antitoxin component of YhaV-PrlF toxin-antitoxin module
VNPIDDRKRIGLKVYDPQVIYVTGDTVVFQRLGVGDVVGAVSEGSAGARPALEFASWPPFDPNDPTEMDVATDFAGRYGLLGIPLEDSFGQIHYGYLPMGMDPAAARSTPRSTWTTSSTRAPEHADHRRRGARTGNGVAALPRRCRARRSAQA